MPFDVGHATGWLNGQAAPSTPVTDLSPHVDGGEAHAQRAAGNDRTVLHVAAAYVIGALLLLWFMGAIVLRTGRL